MSFLQILVPALLVLVGLATNAVANDSFNNRFYVGAGVGQSALKPDPLSTGYRVNKDSGDTSTLFVGWDYSARWSIEATFESLGAARLVQNDGLNLTPAAGNIDYESIGLSGLAYFYNRQGVDGLFERTGLALFVGGGIGALNTTSGNLPIRQLEDAQLTVTAGAEYGFPGGLAGRVQLVGHDRDALAFTLRLLYRFGQGVTRERVEPDPAVPTVIETPAVIVEPVAPPEPVQAVVLDSDNDGVPDELDNCPGSVSGSPVNDTGCAVFNGRIDGVTFASGSDRLTANARNVLDDAAAQLLLYPQVRVAIMAHTDNSGSSDANRALSKKRAVAVARYLIARGVDRQRLQPEAYGETRPIASNADAMGRELNRRVEFRTLQ